MNTQKEALITTQFIIIFILGFWILAMFFTSDSTSNSFTIANRYTNCVEDLSVSGTLGYEDIKDACGHYLK